MTDPDPTPALKPVRAPLPTPPLSGPPKPKTTISRLDISLTGESRLLPEEVELPKSKSQVDLPREQKLVMSKEVPTEDDPSAILSRLIGSMPPGAMRPAEMLSEAERARHNAHVTAMRMVDLEKRRQRRGETDK